MTIKYLCLTGGGPNGLIQLGALKSLNQHNFWNKKELEAIYATSFGSILSVFILLDIEWEIIYDYLIKRPWNKELLINTDKLLSYSSEKGLFDKNLFITLFKPLFSYKNIDLKITLKEFYNFSNVELNIITCDLNTLEEIKYNYIDNPDLSLIDAIYRSSTLPFFFKPEIIDNKCYIDGGMVNNFPINYLINDNIDKSSILGIVNTDNFKETMESYAIIEQDNIFNFFYKFSKIILSSLLQKNNSCNKENDLPYILSLKTRVWTMEFMNKALENPVEREELILNGESQGIEFYNTVSKN